MTSPEIGLPHSRDPLAISRQDIDWPVTGPCKSGITGPVSFSCPSRCSGPRERDGAIVPVCTPPRRGVRHPSLPADPIDRPHSDTHVIAACVVRWLWGSIDPQTIEMTTLILAGCPWSNERRGQNTPNLPCLRHHF
ncbi:MAG: hypothetical protein EOM12_04970 [Verrucomicrobiae bacterium]|nr:hypothetical protein [Verrucomicrobiae bacterium]